MAAFFSCCLVEKNNFFTETLLYIRYVVTKTQNQKTVCSKMVRSNSM